MMLREVHIHHVRNIQQAKLELHPHLNLFFGPNGSGKTSFLESLYMLSCAHSFRTREISAIISKGADDLTVFARSTENDLISIKKNCHKSTLVKFNGRFCRSSSELTRQLPIQVFYQDIFHIIDAGPSVRRNLLDWGLFHVKHHYLALLKDYKQVLKQRNALLKQRASGSQFVIWDRQLSLIAEQIDVERREYFQIWQAVFQQVLSQLTDVTCSLSYFKGWDKKNEGHSLEQILQTNMLSDRQRMYTQQGAHQADLIIQTAGDMAKQLLSRGQQKIILIALKLSQAQLLDQSCIYLFDDLSAELDANHLRRIYSFLERSPNQVFITSNAESFFPVNGKKFQILNGTILAVE